MTPLAQELALSGLGLVVAGGVGILTGPGPRVRRSLARLRQQPAEQPLPFSHRVSVPLGRWAVRTAARLTPEGMRRRLLTRLEQAGMAQWPGPEGYLVRLAVAVAAVLVLAGVALLLRLPWGLDLRFAALGEASVAVLARFGLSQRVSRRQAEIRRALPELLDLVVVSVEAGLGFEAALERTASRRTDPLSAEVLRALAETRLGKTRGEALRDMARRTGVEEVERFAQAVVQADALGTAVAQALRAQADLLRRLRMVRAEEAAATVPVKMLLPMVLFILPGIFLVVLGPTLIQALKALGVVG
jgi:tight adherence protein C